MLVRAIALSLALLAFAGLTSASEAPLRFAVEGGDAWSFQKPIEVVAAPGRCDRLVISSPLAAIVLTPGSEHTRVGLPFGAGTNEIHAECRKNGRTIGEVASQTWHVRLAEKPKAWIKPSLVEQGLALDGGPTEPAPVTAKAIVRYEWRAADGNPAGIAGLPASGRQIVLTRPQADGDYNVILRVTDGAGRTDKSAILFRVQNKRFELVDLGTGHPAWTDAAIVYGVVPSLFGKRGLPDVTAQLDRLAALGVNTIWLSPMTASPPGDFGYAVTDYFRLDPRFGSAADLRELVRAAHERGLRVLLDFVPNHLSSEHPYFKDTVTRAKASPYFDYFARSASGDATHYFDWSNLENLNYGNPEVQRLVIEGFEHWIREFDVDGFRVDAAWGPRQRAPEFWPRWRTELKRIKPDILLIAEASARDPYYVRNGFDAAYDWTDTLGEWAWQEAFDNNMGIAARLRAAIEQSDGVGRVLRFLENNDTGARFISRHGPALTRTGAAMLMTLPGIPALYTGQVIGATYEPYKELLPVVWANDPHHLQDWYSHLIALRRSEPALRSDRLQMVETGSPENVLGYLRTSPDQTDRILVLLNFGNEPVRLPAQSIAEAIGPRAADLLGGRDFDAASSAHELELEPYEAIILKQSRPSH